MCVWPGERSWFDFIWAARVQWNRRDKVEQDTQFDLRGAKAEYSQYTVMGNKTNEARLKRCFHHCGYMTYICRVQECWSLSNVGDGLKTSHLGTQTSVSHCDLLLHNVFNYKSELQSRWVCRFNWCSDRVWFMLHSTRRAMKYPMRARAGLH